MTKVADPEHGIPEADVEQYEGYRIGDHVEYHPTGSSVTSTGVIRSIITHAKEAGTSPHVVKADKGHPRFVIENDSTNKITAYKYEALVRKVESEE